MPMGIWMVACFAVFSLASGNRVHVSGSEAVLTRVNGTGSNEIVQDVKRHEYSQSSAAAAAFMDNSQDLHPQAIKKFFINKLGVSQQTTPQGTPIKLMSLNVEFFTETCDKGLSKGIEHCSSTLDTGCTETVTKMLCCNYPNNVALRDACRRQKCFDVGSADRDDPLSGIWPAYKSDGGNVTMEPPLSSEYPVHQEPSCLQGARNLLQQVVKKHSPHVVATQEDFENYPLMVPGYVTIISANSHDMWYASPPFASPQSQSWLKLMDENRKPVHMVNALLVREEVFNLEETQKLCKEKAGHVYDEFEEGKFYRCGLDLRSQEAAAKKEEMLTGTDEKPKLFGWENVNGETIEKKMPTEKDRILLMASRCAALAVVNVGSGVEQIAIASAHLTGGRFDDDLIGLKEEYRAYEQTQQEEKIKQAVKLADVLMASGKPSIIMGDFNGPDDFDIQWWKVLTAPWPATHPFLGSVFGGKSGNEAVLNPIKKFAEVDANLPKLHTSDKASYWNSEPIKETLGDTWKETKEKLARFEGVYKRWMVGVHEELQKREWKPLAKSQDFTKSFGKVMGTTSKFGGMVDFFYASPGFVQYQTCTLPNVDAEVDFSNGEIGHETVVKTCQPSTGIASWAARKVRGSGIVSAMNVRVVHGVLKRSTDHAPVIAELTIQKKQKE